MSTLKKNLGFYQGLALYLAAVLGTGILVIPLMAWAEGGPASLIAWFALGILGLSLAWTFASVGAQEPDAGGVQAMIGRIFGPKVEALCRYLVYFSIPAGAVAGGHILAYHLCAAFGLPLSYIPFFAYGCWVLITLANYFGIQVSASAQLLLSSLLVLLLVVFLFAAIPEVRVENFTPFFSHGFAGVGRASIMVFWSFLGWEAIAHLAEEFKNPERDMMRAAIVAGILVGVLYFAVSFVLIGTGATSDAGHMAPLVTFAGRAFGNAGRTFTGVMAALVCIGTMNAYMAGLSRLGYSMARAGDLPNFIGKIERDGTPRSSVLVQFVLNCFALLIQQVFHLPLKFFFLVPNLSFLILYILGCLSAAQLLRGRRIAVYSAYFSAFICAAMIPFASGVWAVPVVIASLAYLKIRIADRSK